MWCGTATFRKLPAADTDMCCCCCCCCRQVQETIAPLQTSLVEAELQLKGCLPGVKGVNCDKPQQVQLLLLPLLLLLLF
jgi:hypothetical protein